MWWKCSSSCWYGGIISVYNCSTLWNADTLGGFDAYARNVAIIIMLHDNIGTPKGSVWIMSTKIIENNADKI